MGSEAVVVRGSSDGYQVWRKGVPRKIGTAGRDGRPLGSARHSGEMDTVQAQHARAYAMA